jgi:hypothetical protein
LPGFACPILMPDVEERANVRMIERRQRPRLAIESLSKQRVGGERCREDLDRNRAIQPRVAGAKHFPHAAGAERRDDFIGAEPRAGEQCHGSGRNYRGCSDSDESGMMDAAMSFDARAQRSNILGDL